MRVLHRDFLQRLQAIHREARAGHVDRAHALACQRFQRLLRVRLQPAFLAEARLEGQQDLAARNSQRFGDGDRAGLALCRVGIAAIDQALRDAVERQQQAFATAVECPMRADRIGDRRGPAGVAVVVLQHRNLQAFSMSCDGVGDAGGRRRRILRIQRQHADRVHAFRTQRIQRGADRWLAIAHRMAYAPTRQAHAHRIGQRFGMHRQR